MSSINSKKRELYNKWTKLKRLSNNDKLTYTQYYKIREVEEESYKKWDFLDKYTKANEKISKKEKIK